MSICALSVACACMVGCMCYVVCFVLSFRFLRYVMDVSFSVVIGFLIDNFAVLTIF